MGARAVLADSSSRRVTRSVVAANVIGALLVFLFLGFALPAPQLGRHTGPVVLTNMAAFVAFMAVVIPAGIRLGKNRGAATRQWLTSGRRPNDAERRRALREPLRLLPVLAALWTLAAACFAALNLAYSGRLALNVGITVLLGGMVTCALAYLRAERAWRDVVAAALATDAPTEPAVPGVAARLLFAWALGSAVPLLAIVLVGVDALTAQGAPGSSTSLSIIFVATVAIGVGLLATVSAGNSVVEPVESVRRAMTRVQSGDLHATVAIDDASELGLLEAGFNRMAADLRERERLRDLFSRQVGEDVAAQALERDGVLGGELRHVGVLFVDLIGSTQLTVAEPPDEVVAQLNRFFATVVTVIARHDGSINKFQGDAALCVFGASADQPDAARRALAAARDLSRTLRTELPELPAAIGVSAGPAVAGNVGAAERFEYTVIGPPVNEAARLTDAAKPQPERLLATRSALDLAGDDEARYWRAAEPLQLRGFAEPTTLVRPA